MTRNLIEEIYKAIRRIQDRNPMRSTGKFSAVNVALEANVSRATLYRLLTKDRDLRTAFDSAQNGDTSLPLPLKTAHDAYAEATKENKELRKSLAIAKKQLADQETAFIQKLFILKRMVSQLDSENSDLRKSVEQYLGEKNKFSIENQNLKIENAHLKRTQGITTAKPLPHTISR